MTRVIALLVTLVMLAGCKQPDPFGGCRQHPGQCGQRQ